jgi:hypothetical protein
MATDANSLLAEAACYGCTGQGLLQLLKLGLLRQLLLASDPMADTTPNTLLASAACYGCVSDKDRQLLELGLLKAIVDAGGLGTGGITTGTDAPTDPPASGAGVYYKTDTFNLYVWNPDTSNWDQLI